MYFGSSTGLDQDIWNAQGEIGAGNHPQVGVGVTFSVPLENRSARADYRSAKLDQRRVRLQLRQLTRRIGREIRAAGREVKLAAARVKQTGRTEILQQQKLIAETEDAYVSTAVALAENTDQLIELRGNLRPAMAASPLCDASGFTRDVEAVYRRMWQNWCQD